MFKIAIIIFRECLEIALLLGVILASTSHIKNSRIYVIMGAMTGIVLASIFAFFIRTVTIVYGTYGDEIFDSSVILLTAVIISWTVVWMQGYTQKIKNNLGKLAEKIITNNASKTLLVAIVASTIFREGAEIILLVYGISSASLSASEYVIGLVIGSISGFIVGVVIYTGLIKLAGKYIFKVSTILLILIAAGLASEAAGILTSVGVIEMYRETLWDTSWLIDNNSIVGKLLHITVGYDSKPNGMQIIFYLSSIMFTLTMMKIRTLLTKSKYA
jgi:high-affinity iron transporter